MNKTFTDLFGNSPELEETLLRDKSLKSKRRSYDSYPKL